MARSKSSAKWLQEHFQDTYVKKAQQEGFRSRAAYKLMEIQDKRKFIRRGMRVVDLGAAPGGWSQVAAPLVGPTGQVVALDLLPIAPLTGVTIIQGDFTDPVSYTTLMQTLQGRPVDVVLCDMAPNLSGQRSVDQYRAMHLLESALAFAHTVMQAGGIFLAKAFYGAGFDLFLKDLRVNSTEVKVYKPDASRSRSAECYLYATLKAVAKSNAEGV